MSNSDCIIIHLSDFHFGGNTIIDRVNPQKKLEEFSELILNEVKQKYVVKNIVIAIGGDITDKGKTDNYAKATLFFSILSKKLKNYSIAFIACPGNHDIKSEGKKNFNDFNIFVSKLTRKSELIFNEKQSVNLIETFELSFVVINSVQHLDHTYGLIDLDQFKEAITKAQHPSVVLLHHNLIPIFEEDISTVRNSYLFLQECVNNGKVKAIIHGHVHSSFTMELGFNNNKSQIFGVGAFLPDLRQNQNNQFNIYSFRNGDVVSAKNYSILADATFSSNPTIKEQSLI